MIQPPTHPGSPEIGRAPGSLEELDREFAVSLIRSTNGDDAAREECFRRIVPFIEKAVRGQLAGRPRQVKEDVAQEVAYRLIRRWPREFATYDPCEPALPLVRTIVRRMVWKEAHRRCPEIPTAPENFSLFADQEDRPVEETADTGAPATLDAQQQLAAVLDHVATWPDVDQTIFRSKLVERRPSREVASELGMSVNNIDVRATRLRAGLKRWAARQRWLILLLVWGLSAWLWW